jgi:hypothetical protein
MISLVRLLDSSARHQTSGDKTEGFRIVAGASAPGPLSGQGLPQEANVQGPHIT